MPEAWDARGKNADRDTQRKDWIEDEGGRNDV